MTLTIVKEWRKWEGGGEGARLLSSSVQIDIPSFYSLTIRSPTNKMSSIFKYINGLERNIGKDTILS